MRPPDWAVSFLKRFFYETIICIIYRHSGTLPSGLYSRARTGTRNQAGIEITGEDAINIPGGGAYSVTYKLENETENGTVSAECPADWISDTDCSMKGNVTFTVSANDTEEERSTVLTICYEYEAGKSVEDSINIIQESTSGDEPEKEYDYEYDTGYLTGVYYGAIGENGEYNYYTWLSDLPFDSGGMTMIGGTYYLFDIYGQNRRITASTLLPPGHTGFQKARKNGLSTRFHHGDSQ